MEIRHPTSGGHTKGWQSITPTWRTTKRYGNASPKLEAPQLIVGIHQPNTRGHTEAWESIIPTRANKPTITPSGGAGHTCGVHHPNSNRSDESVGIHRANLKGKIEVWESTTPTQRATPKFGSSSPRFEKATEVGMSINKI